MYKNNYYTNILTKYITENKKNIKIAKINTIGK